MRLVTCGVGYLSPMVSECHTRLDGVDRPLALLALRKMPYLSSQPFPEIQTALAILGFQKAMFWGQDVKGALTWVWMCLTGCYCDLVISFLLVVGDLGFSSSFFCSPEFV